MPRKNWQYITLDIYIDNLLVSSDDIEESLDDDAFCELSSIAESYTEFIKKHCPGLIPAFPSDESRVTGDDYEP